MAKLNRLTAKIFGETASTTNTPKEIGQFGSAKAGTYNATGDVATIQSLPAWSNGWIDSVTPTDQFPPLPEMTGVHKVLSYQNAYLLQQGIPEWDGATTYYKNNYCSYEGTVYKSIADESLGNQPYNGSEYWEVYGVITDYANKDLMNLTTLGNSRLQFAPFSINQGTVLNGENNTLTYSGSDITCDPCTITAADGKTYVDTASATYDVSTTADGDYSIFKNIETGSLTLLSDFSISKTIPINVSITGSLTNENGVLSGFSTFNYATLPSRFQPAVANGETWELVIPFETSDVATTQILFSDGVGSSASGQYGFVIEIYSSTLQVVLDWSSSGVGVSGNTPLTNNTKYWVKVTFDGTKYECFISTDGVTYTSFYSYSTTSPLVSSGNATYLGVWYGFTTPAIYSKIYLDESYIKINNQTWWKGVSQNYLNTSTIPANLYVNGEINNDLVYIGNCTIESGVVTSITNRKFNDSGYLIDRNYNANFAAMSPDLSAGVSKSTSGFTADEDGWLYVKGLVGGSSAAARGLVIAINSTEIAIVGVSGSTSITNIAMAFLPINNGDVITIVSSGRGDSTFTFFPLKGVN